ncbi:MAG: hypothetical protein K6D94_03580 [Clostridiales bacterium]|nr:hypothetical protein [Clostridiales bacterium]
MKIRSAISLLLASLLAPSVFAACGADEGSRPQAAVTTAAEDTAVAETEDGTLKDTVPQLDFGGAKLRTIQQGPRVYYFWAEEENGDPLIDTVFRRIQNAEERLNIDVVETELINWADVSAKLKQSVQAGSDDYDLVLNQIFRSGSDAVGGFMYDWNQIPYITLSQPWYTKSIQDASLGDRLYMIESDLSTSYTEQTWFILFNKKLAENSGLTGLYESVGDGKWTADYLYELGSSLYQDLNGDSKEDDEDLYGYGTSVSDACMTAALYYALGGRMVELDRDTMTVNHVISEEKNIRSLEKLASLLYTMPNVYNKLEIGSATRLQMFTSNKFVFCMCQVGVLTNELLRAFDDPYGVLPLPKYDESQSEYYTLVDGGADILTIPATLSNPEMLGAAVEVMSCYSYNYNTPAFMNIGLEQKGTRDEESITMLRSILDSRVIDFGYLYDTGSGWCMNLNAIIKKPDAIASAVEKKTKSVNKYYEKIIEQFTSEG